MHVLRCMHIHIAHSTMSSECIRCIRNVNRTENIFIGLFARAPPVLLHRRRRSHYSIEKVTECLHNATVQAIRMFIVQFYMFEHASATSNVCHFILLMHSVLFD